MSFEQGQEPRRHVPLPHQQEFIDRFFTSPSRAHWLVQAVGMGSSSTAALVVQRYHSSVPKQRVLLLAPFRVLQAQITDVLQRFGVPALQVDRYRYRELQEGAPAGVAIWPAGGVFILSTAFAKQDDIANSLAQAEWGLIVLLEAQEFKGPLERLVRDIAASSPELRLLAVSNIADGDIPAFQSEPYEVTRWTGADVSTQKVPANGGMSIKLIPFQRTAREQQLFSMIERLMQSYQLSEATRETLLSLPFKSSPAALEGKLRSLRNRLAHGDLWITDSEMDPASEAMTADELTIGADVDKQQFIASLDQKLEELEHLSEDPKLNVFMHELRQRPANQDSYERVVVLTDYRSTLFYLHSHLDEAGYDPTVVHGAMSSDNHMRAIEYFARNGGVLLATRAMMVAGFDLPNTNRVFFYDVPQEVHEFQQLIGRFNRIGNLTPLQVYLMSDLEGGSLNAVEKLKDQENL